MTPELRVARAARSGRAGGGARAPARPRRRRARPLPRARRARPRAAPARDHAPRARSPCHRAARTGTGSAACRRPDPETFHATFAPAAAFLDALPVPIDRVVLGGFSQGSVMSYALGLGQGRPRPAAIIALSGFVPRVPGFSLDLDGLDGYPIAIAHGSCDPVIPVGFGQEARDLLDDSGRGRPLPRDAGAAHDRSRDHPRAGRVRPPRHVPRRARPEL